MKLLSLFSGIGAFEKALENLGEPVDLINYCEIDKYASKAFALIHHVDESMNLKDVCSVKPNELPKDIDLITYGFPCQDISNAGKQRGFVNEDGQLTRSGLFFAALHIIEETKPKIAIAENVKALTSKKFSSEFQTVLTSLNQAGYQNYWSVLNAKDYGIPQNRERVFIISIRNDIAHGFDFPQKQELKLRLKDLLEDNVEEKYFLSDNSIIEESKDGCLLIKEATEKGFKEAHEGDYVNIQYPKSKTRRGRVGDQIANTLICTDNNGVVTYGIDKSNNNPKSIEIANCITAREDRGISNHKSEGTAVVEQTRSSLRVRKLTPKECLRLMGFDDRDCDILIENKISNTQLYKMAGNSIVVDVLEQIFLSLFNQYQDIFHNNLKIEKSQENEQDASSDWESRQITIFDLLNYKEV